MLTKMWGPLMQNMWPAKSHERPHVQCSFCKGLVPDWLWNVLFAVCSLGQDHLQA